MLQVHHRIVESLLQLLEAERSGEAVNRYLLKRAVDMLSNLRLYEDGVQETLLASAAEYYSREGSALINVRLGSRRGPSPAWLVEAFRPKATAVLQATSWHVRRHAERALPATDWERRSWSWPHTCCTASGAWARSTSAVRRTLGRRCASR